jgi:hypothetical protein
MSTKFVPIEIPPGVVANPTKRMRSSNWAQVNLMRWVEGELQPVGGQSQYTYTFASRCKRIHGWYDLAGVYHVAYVCEQHVYVDTLGTLVEITPAGGLAPPALPAQGGYGDLNYGDDTYGDPRAGSVFLAVDRIPDCWSVDNFGQILLIMSSVDGRLLEWDPSATTGTVLTQTTGSPSGRCFVVTQERFVIIYGMYNDGTTDIHGNPDGGSARRFGWCNEEDRNAWDFSNVDSQAGFLDIEPASPIICAENGRFGVLFFTAKKAYVTRYIGLPYIHDYLELADDCTPYSPASVTSTSYVILWMSQQGMFSFDGVNITPIACTIRTWIDDDIEVANAREQACIGHVGNFNEVWWFFPQKGQLFNTRVAIYNYKEQWWSQGQMSRSACVTSSYTQQPIMADGTVAFEHELGSVYGNADPPWAETFDLNLVNGAKFVTLKQVIPDLREAAQAAEVQFQFSSQRTRSQGDPEVWTTPVPIRQDGYVDARVTGRDIRMKISCIGPQIVPFTLGQHLVDIVVRGDR